MAQEPLFHFEDEDGTHYYKLWASGYRYGNDTTYLHPDGTVEKCAFQGWYMSDKSLDLDKFYHMSPMSEVEGWELKEELPNYINRDTLPDYIEYSDSEEFERPNPEFYVPKYKRWEEERYVTGEWIEAKGAPCPKVNFAWRTHFPHVVRNFPETHHLFPCSVNWKETHRIYLEDFLKNKYKGKAQRVYVFDDYISIDFENVANVVAYYPRLSGSNLVALSEEFNNWLHKIIAKADRQALYNERGMVDGVFYDSFDYEEFERRVNEAIRVAVYSAKKADQSRVRGELKRLRQYVWKQIQAAALWESGVTPPDYIEDDIA